MLTRGILRNREAADAVDSGRQRHRLLKPAITLALLLVSGIVVSEQARSASKSNIESQITQNERALVNAEKQHDSGTFDRLLRSDLIYVAFNGWVFTKKDLVSKMSYIDVRRYQPANFKVRTPSPHTALITYDLKASASVAGISMPRKQYVSSLWVESGGKWQLLFHQATPATHP